MPRSFRSGQTVVVDIDYSGQTGYVGSGSACAHVAKAASIHGDVEFIRRVSINVARVVASDGSGLQLATRADAPALLVPECGCSL